MIEPDFGKNPEWQLEDASDLMVTDLSSLSVREWTSEDYSMIFVKYRPRLVSYAHKFLSDPGSVDEVVQDAFLYLFMSLPELDSELGVLKYLKWKTRYLALDLLRAQGKRPALFAVAEDAEELVEPEAGVDAFLSGVDDAAIVSLALSRIPDRHREVLVRSVLEQESAREIGDSMGMTENATRQLLHRARASFREQVALVAADHNTTISAFLSTAVKKAKEAGVKGAAMVLLLAIPALGIGMLYRGIGWNPSDAPAIVQPAPSNPASEVPVVEPTEEPTSEPVAEPSAEPSEEPVVEPSAEPTAEAVSALALERDSNISIVSEIVDTETGRTTSVLQTTDGMTVQLESLVTEAGLDLNGTFTIVIDGRPVQLPTLETTISRRLNPEIDAYEVTLTAYLMDTHLVKKDQKLAPDVVVITLQYSLDYSMLISAEIFKV